MTARVLIVDDVFPNIKLLETRLSAEYYEVVSAMNGPQAIEICARGECDIVLLDVMMPGMDGFEVCKRLKSAPHTAHLPIVMVTALDQPADRLRGLEAGADDFLTKPLDETALLARVKSLTRLKAMTDELRARAIAAPIGGGEQAIVRAMLESGTGGRVLLVEDRASAAERISSALAAQHAVEIEPDAQAALLRLGEKPYDVVIVSLALAGFDPLRLVSQVRALERLRGLPVLLLAEPGDEKRLHRGFDLGVNDYLLRPVDRNELMARVATQVRRKRYQDSLRENVQASMEMAIQDALTGLYNRRYLDRQMIDQLALANAERQRLSLVIVDLDHFKRVNDTYGHDAGDEVLKAAAARIKAAVRGIDVVARFGGEEFVIIMPDTPTAAAQRVAERIRKAIEREPIRIGAGGALSITASLGVATSAVTQETPESLLKKADVALYEAKRRGRNQVVHAAA